MKYFHYHTQQTHYDKELKKTRCIHVKKDNTRCKNNIIIGHKHCHIHRKIALNLMIKKSTIENAGDGLFAFKKGANNNEIVFKKDAKICDYIGEVIDDLELRRRYGRNTAPYAIQLYNGLSQDAAIIRGIGALANHDRRKANVRLSIKRDNSGAQLVATKNIKNNEELFINYGNSYKFNENNVYTRTNNRKYN